MNTMATIEALERQGCVVEWTVFFSQKTVTLSFDGQSATAVGETEEVALSAAVALLNARINPKKKVKKVSEKRFNAYYNRVETKKKREQKTRVIGVQNPLVPEGDVVITQGTFDGRGVLKAVEFIIERIAE